MTKAPIESLVAQVGSHRDFDSPPLHLWHPPFCGEIPIRINARGIWYHEGRKIERESLVRLFASILRREEDSEYYLVTPVEKWRIEVELHPLLVTDINILEVDGVQVLEATLNTGKRMLINKQHPLSLDTTVVDIPTLSLPHGLTALCTRPTWYRLVELADSRDGFATLKSGDFEIRLPTT